MKARDITKALKKKGFKEEQGKNHTKYFLYVNGKKTRIMTVFSRGSNKKELTDDLLKRIRKQLKFDDEKLFKDFIKCPMGYWDYVEMLRQKKAI